MHAVVFSGRRCDTGDKLGYLKAVIELALRRPDLGPGLRAWLAGCTTRVSSWAEGSSGAVRHGDEAGQGTWGVIVG